MYVIKRSGKREKVSFDKVLRRIQNLSFGLDQRYVSCEEVAKKTILGIYDGVKTSELDVLAAEIAASMVSYHPDYSILAGRIITSNLHKQIQRTFSENVKALYHYVDPQTGKKAPLVSKELFEVSQKYAKELDSAIVRERDFDYDYFGVMTMVKGGYILKMKGEPAEIPQYMLMRVALGINLDDINQALKTYEFLSKKYYTHASPTLFNAGTVNPQLSSCFLVAMKDDSIEGIYDTLKECARISQFAGGLGLHIHNIRSKGSYIKGTGGTSNGIVPMLRVFNETARYVDQGGGKRKGAFAVYLEPWHADIFEFLELKKNVGKEELRARDLFYALWVPDLFMERVLNDDLWSLMDPNVSRGLSDCYGDEFKELYEKYEKEGKFVRQVKARDLWFKIIESQIETGVPYMLYKDSANKKSNQKNLGTIKSSNLCAEIIEYSSPDETAVCNLASISLPKFLKKNGEFNHKKLFEVVSLIVRNIDKIIDINFYSTEAGKRSNLRHRPMGIGVQGLADLFAMLNIPFDSKEAQSLNEQIFETIYYAALSESNKLAKKYGAYETFKDSPASKGLLQFDLWGKKPYSERSKEKRWDWKSLKKDIKEYGLRNSLLIALMPTASTSQILGNNESFEPFTANVYVRRVLHGEFIVVNKYLIKKLIDLGIWSEELRQRIIYENGSIQNIDEIPEDLKKVYRTVWEIPQRSIIDMAAQRGLYVDQSQSMNIYMEDPDIKKITSMHFYAWKAGLKTGMYYLRSRPARDAIKFTIDKTKVARSEPPKPQEEAPNVCISCGS